MKSFQCQTCGQFVYFENTRCLRCLSALGYLPTFHAVCAFEPDGAGRWRALLPGAEGTSYRLCRNGIDWQACNWMVPADGDSEYCLACRLNLTVPDLSSPLNVNYWRKLERGKRRLIYSLTRLGLPVVSKADDREKGMAFEFLSADDPLLDEHDGRVMTGHKNGVITVNIAEADDLHRERIRLDLNEVYRSVLGHFRHESGHYYWLKLIEGGNLLAPFRTLFGDETADYLASIDGYYQSGPPRGWADAYVSAYASCHPWEDWAECWAHYLTIVDGLETANSYGVQISANRVGALFPPVDGYRAGSFAEMLEQWLPLTYAVNSINRSAGQNELYPFILSTPVIAKLEFIHDVIESARKTQPGIRTGSSRMP